MQVGQRVGYDQITIDSKVQMEETADEIIFRDVVIAREIVQPYEVEGKEINMYKPADELEAAAWTGEDMWIMMDKHPDNIVIDNRDDKHGKVRNIRFVKNLVDHKTKRPNQRGLLGDAHFFKQRISPAKQGDLRAIINKDAKTNRDVSIGFFYTPLLATGRWNGAAYDVKQINIDLNHLAAPISGGRCPMPYCGIGADAIELRLAGFDPEQTENYIHIPVKDKGLFVADSFKTKILSEDQGILAVMGKLKTDPDGSMVIQKYLFKKDKGWTMEKAKSWVNKHKDEDAMETFAELQAADFGNTPVAKMLVAAVKLYKLASDSSLEEIEAKIKALKQERDDIRDKIDQYYKDNPPQKTPPELEALYEKLDDVLTELRAYQEAKVMKIAGQGDKAETWVKFISWKQNRQAYDALPVHLQQLIREYNLCPDCEDAAVTPAIDYDKAPEDTEWEFDAGKYSVAQLKHACAIVEKPSGEKGELTKGDCKLPHHLPGDGKTHGGTLVWRGVAAAGAALRGARGASITGESAAKAKTHLASHYKEFDKTPPWKQDEKGDWVDEDKYDAETAALVAAESNETVSPEPKLKKTWKPPTTEELLNRPDLYT